MDGTLDVAGTTSLHLGCGSVMHPRPWLNVDLHVPTDVPEGVAAVAVDLTQFPWPRQSGSVERIYAEHVVEHFDQVDGDRLMAQMLRVLEPGGRVRLAMPDLDRIVDLFVRGPGSPYWNRTVDHYGLDDPTVLVNRILLGEAVGGLKYHNSHVTPGAYADGHRHYYTFDHLRDRLSRAGFVDVVRVDLGVSSDPGMLVETRQPMLDLVVEARRP